MRYIMQAALLSDRGIVRVSGADVRRFLNGLFTADIESMTATAPRYAALLTPQGKIVADFIVVQADGDDAGFLLDCERALAGPLVAKLNFYKLRAKVTVESLAETMGALALWDADAAPARQPGAPWFPDPRLGALGWRAIAPPALAAELAAAQGAALVDEVAYEAHRIALGVPRGGCDFAYGDAFPHEADMDQLNGVAFDKGCYVGQEVVSRMQHRGNVRNRVVPVRIDGAAPAPGTPVVVGDKTVGAVGSAADGRGLALLRLDRVADAMGAGLSLLAGTAELHPVKPAWAKFPWPDAAKAAE
ncbi:MAG: folate-binding protein [Xanthobacteraceae bacterium]